MTGLLIGSDRLANKHADGYLWYLLMHGSTAWLMGIRDYVFLATLQIVSSLFIVSAWKTNRERHTI